jgi:glycosyltransferase involved in cell wall biosynthesis
MQDIPLGSREPIILSVGQFRPEKDHVLQIRAFAKFLEGGAPWESRGMAAGHGCHDYDYEDRLCRVAGP